MDFKRSLPATLYEQVTADHPYRFRGRAVSRPGSVLLDSRWALVLDDSCGSRARLGAEDLRSLLKKTFGRTLARTRKKGGPIMRARVDRAISSRAETYHLRVDANKVEIVGRDDVAVMRALLHLGRRMLLAREPRLAMGQEKRSPQWHLRIASPVVHRLRDEPRDYLRLPRSYLLNLARYGYNAIFIYMDWIDFMSGAVAGPLARSGWKRRLVELNRAAEYLGEFGVQLLFHINTPALPARHRWFKQHPGARGAQTWSEGLHCLCSSSPRVLRLYRHAARQLFADVPALAGAVLIVGGECFLHCYTRPMPRPEGKTNCPRCAKLSPQRVIGDVVNAFARGTWEANGEAHVLMWPYSAFSWGNLSAQRELVSLIDDEVGLLAAFEKDSTLTIDGQRSYAFDYSISQLGPSPRFEALRKAGRKCGLRVYAKTETSASIEMFNVPRIPVMHRWSQRYAALRDAQLAGVHTSWRLHGFSAQRTDEIVDYFNWAEKPDVDKFLSEVAARDFGPSAARSAVTAWRQFSRAFELFPYSSGLTGFPYFRGPFFIGPAQPLVFDLTGPLGLSDRFWAVDPSLAEGVDDAQLVEATRSPTFFLDLTWTQPWGPRIVTERLRRMDRLWQQGVAKLTQAEPAARGAERDRLRGELDVARMIGCMFRTALHLVRYQQLRESVVSQPCTMPTLRRTCRSAMDILEEELVNARTALTLVERDSSLGFGATYGVAFDAELIQEKIRHTQHHLEHVVPRYFTSYAFHMFGRSEEL